MNNNLPSGSIAQAVEILKKEEVIAYPTEAVFGVGCDPDSEVAVNRLLALKQRPVEKGLILIAANYAQLKPYIDDSMLTPAQRETIFCVAWSRDVCFSCTTDNAALVNRAFRFTCGTRYRPSAGGGVMPGIW